MYRKKRTQALVLSEVLGVHCGYWNVSPVVKGELCVCMCVFVCVSRSVVSDSLRPYGL